MEIKIKRFLVALIGLCVAGVGVGVFLYSNLGVDPASVFQTGLSKQLGISYGTASALSNLIIIIVILFIDKSYINISTLLAIFSIGYSADFTRTVLNLFIQGEMQLLPKLLFILLGCFVMALGVAVYIKAGLGVGAVDSVSQVISDKLKLDYKKIRVTSDLLFVLVGTLLGGAVGIGTLVAAFLTGPFIQMIRPKTDPFIQAILKNDGGR
ncbi:YczE/YyaS/YitT family protein [Proteiniclasticum ruminis]|uniref:YczE/YyaS/YitT family protein n=1 Tax=Proteiniclasticum ruminis TaxID=398199 RepID=UPI0028ADE2F3|nr:membrane protein [Proteiniclasticum ruminis]